MSEDLEMRYCHNHERNTMHIIVRSNGCVAKLCCACLANEYTKRVLPETAYAHDSRVFPDKR